MTSPLNQSDVQQQLHAEGAMDYESTIMGGLIPYDSSTELDALENLNYALSKLDLEKLKPENRALIGCMSIYREETSNKGTLSEEVLIDMLMSENAPPETQVKYQQLFNSYASTKVSEAKFRYAIVRFLHQVEEREYVEALNEAYTVYSSGLRQGRNQLKGYKDSRNHLNRRLYELSQLSNTSGVQEGNLRQETKIAVEEMKERKEEPKKFKGILTGIPEVDETTNGIQAGELVIIGGFTEVGKSFLCLNMALHACVEQGLNVAIGTAETLYRQYRLRAYVRHARRPEFGLPQGIETKAYEKGMLTVEEEAGFVKAMDDFNNNPAYGSFHLFQIPKGADLAWINNKLIAYNSVTPLDAFWLDSLALVVPTGKGDNKRSYMNDMIKEYKQMASNFDKQRGIAAYTPWHANRKSWEKALKDGVYNLGSWSEADELERSADIVLWLLKLENSTDTHEIQSGICKSRSGKSDYAFTLYEDFASAYIGSVAAGRSSSGSTSTSTGLPDGMIGDLSMDERVKDLF